ncbi:MAG TPA: glycogen/starch synthase [Polyangiaceae bacterium]|nr:glycogen/starch synthase [Polyangiaceae bacterium]
MDILMVSAELSPYARGSEVGDVVAGLSKALRQLGHRVTLALPRHPGFEAGGLLMARRLTPLSLGGSDLTVLDGQLASGVELALFDDPPLYDRPSVFGEGEGYEDNLARFAVLCRGAAALAQLRAEQGKPFEVAHAFDAPAAALPALLKQPPALALPTLLTVLDTERAGRYSSGAHAAFPGLRGNIGDSLSLLELGLASAQLVVAGSEDAARELGTPRVSGPLASSLLGERTPSAVSSGLDYALFNPATDTALPARFDAEDASNKGRCKSAVLSELSLELELDRPLVFALAGSLTEAQLLLGALPLLLKNDIAVVASVPPSAVAELDRLVADYPADLARIKDNSDATRRRALAAADFALCLDSASLTPASVQAAQRYGAVPVAFGQGAVVDALVDCDAELETGTGFLFDSADADALIGAATRAFSGYGSPGHARLRRRVMRLDVSWERVARRYAQLYRKAAS